MPNRYIREGINDSRTICQLGWQGEVFYRRLMLAVDDFGRAEADAEILRCELFKRQLAKVSEADIERLLVECENTNPPSLFTYQYGSKRYLVMNTWDKGRAKYSKHPEPPESVCKRLQTPSSVNTPEHMSPRATTKAIPNTKTRATDGAHLPEAEIPSWKEFWEYCQSLHCGLTAEWFAKDKFEAANSDKWKNKSDWRSYARRCKGWWEQDGRPMKGKSNANSNPNRSDRNAGTYNATTTTDGIKSKVR